MKTEPNIGDIVWIYIYDQMWECEVIEQRPMWSDTDDELGKCYRIKPLNGIYRDEPDGFLIQRKFFFPTPRESINAEIAKCNTNIKDLKNGVDELRATIKAAKNKRANLQRLLEKYR